MNTELIVIGMVIVLLSSVVGWCCQTNPDLGGHAREFLLGLFGLPALVGLGVLCLLLLGARWLNP